MGQDMAELGLARAGQSGAGHIGAWGSPTAPEDKETYQGGCISAEAQQVTRVVLTQRDRPGSQQNFRNRQQKLISLALLE